MYFSARRNKRVFEKKITCSKFEMIQWPEREAMTVLSTVCRNCSIVMTFTLSRTLLCNEDSQDEVKANMSQPLT